MIVTEDKRTTDGAIADRATPSTCRPVVTYTMGDTPSPPGHEAATRAEIARRLVAFTGYAYAGEYDPAAGYDASPYFVPSATLTTAAANRLGISGAHDLFGGVVPHAFAASKAITHPLVSGEARAPAGWSSDFPHRVEAFVLEGFTAFEKMDALQAGHRLLQDGHARIKLASGIAGMGQWVARNASELERIVAEIPVDEFAQGVVVEQNLTELVTHSVGHVRVADMVATYCGSQSSTTSNHGHEVYGGSRLFVVRGDFDTLLVHELTDDMRLAIAQARAYDDAAHACFPGFFALRRNYDVAQGVDARGRRCSGVLEQSWRLGGASGAEIAALEAFCANPSLASVHASTREIYGETVVVPERSTVYYQGIDPRVGPLSKYAFVENHDQQSLRRG